MRCSPEGGSLFVTIRLPQGGRAGVGRKQRDVSTQRRNNSRSVDGLVKRQCSIKNYEEISSGGFADSAKPVAFPAEVAGVNRIANLTPWPQANLRNNAYLFPFFCGAPDSLSDVLPTLFVHLINTICGHVRVSAGSIPSELGSLDALTVLDLSSNKLEGEITSEKETYADVFGAAVSFQIEFRVRHI